MAEQNSESLLNIVTQICTVNVMNGQVLQVRFAIEQLKINAAYILIKHIRMKCDVQMWDLWIYRLIVMFCDERTIIEGIARE